MWCCPRVEGRPTSSDPTSPGTVAAPKRRLRASFLGVARKLALVGLILLILLLVLPLEIGMAMGVCPDCQAPGPHDLCVCIALAASIILFISTFAVRIESRSRSMPLLLIPRLLERPPGSA